jgi:hypothetical protein
MSAEEQTSKLARFIMEELDEGPIGDEGAGDTAIRIMKELVDRSSRCRATVEALKNWAGKGGHLCSCQPGCPHDEVWDLIELGKAPLTDALS